MSGHKKYLSVALLSAVLLPAMASAADAPATFTPEQEAKIGKIAADYLVAHPVFAAVNAAACLEIDPEMALHAACEKFIRRFGAMEQAARSRGARLDELTRHELLQLWNEQKSAR